MATLPSTSDGASASNESEQLPNCIIASSDRHADLKPFCDNLYATDLRKWGCILPWEFPQMESREVEEHFLRKFFTDLEIHMQGGAHGTGAGFRFLKQAWYSIALYNYGTRAESIATWWLDENVSTLEDPMMSGHLCNPNATPETYFEPRFIQDYGRKLLECVIPHIQGRVKARQEQLAQKTPVIEAQRPTSGAAGVPNEGQIQLQPPRLSTAVPPPASEDHSTGASTYSRVSSGTASFPGYHEPSMGDRSKRGYSRDYNTSYGHSVQQVPGRKHQGRCDSNGGNRHRYDQRQQEFQPHYMPSMQHPAHGGFNPNTPLVTATITGSMAAHGIVAGGFSNVPFTMQGVPPDHAYYAHDNLAPGGQALEPYPPPRESLHRNTMNPAAFNNSSRQQSSKPRNFTHGSDSDKFSRDRQASHRQASHTSFNYISSTSGDARISSFGSRGGSIRGQPRGGRGRGGRSRDSVQETPVFGEQHFNRRASNDYYPKAVNGHVRRHGSAHQEGGWRSISEHRQMENTLPQRVLSGPDQFASFQDSQGPTGPHLLPAFAFPPDPTRGRGQAQVYIPQHTPPLPDVEVNRKYIGPDASNVNELIVFNIPPNETEAEVANAFAHSCDTVVYGVRLFKRRPEGYNTMAYIQVENHHVARRILDFREVEFYGQPLHVEVPDRYHSGYSASRKAYANMNYNQAHHHATAGESATWYHHQAGGSAQQSQYNFSMVPVATPTHSSETMRSGYAGQPPSTPFRPARVEPALSTVQSANTTPAGSGPDTPKKMQRKKSKQNKAKALLVSNMEGGDSTDAGKLTALETPARLQIQKQARQDSLTSAQTQTSDGFPASKKTKPSKNPQPSRDLNDSSVKSDGMPAVHEAPTKPRSHGIDGHLASPENNALTVSKDSIPAKELPATNNSKPKKKLQASKEIDVSKAAPQTELPKVAPKPEPSSDRSQPSRSKVASNTKSKETDVSKATPKTALPEVATEPASEHSQTRQSDVRSDSTPKVSPRSQMLVKQSVQANPIVDHATTTVSSTGEEPLPQSSSSPTPESVRPGSVERAASDSDLVDESFHTASASPPGGMQPQDNDSMARFEKSPSPAQVTELKTNTRDSASPAPSKNSKTSMAIVPNSSPKPVMSIKIQGPTPPKDKKRSEISAKETKVQLSASMHDVADVSKTRNESSLDQKSGGRRDEITAPNTTISTQDVSSPLKDTLDSRTAATSTAQRVDSSSLALPTPEYAPHAAPTTSMPQELPHAADKPSGQSKVPAKKGPSQTESLSLFGKKQQKQKKPARPTKVKGTLKSKPLDSVGSVDSSSGIMSRDASCSATSASMANDSESGKRPPTLDTRSKTDSRSRAASKLDRTVPDVGTKAAVSRQESPSKGGIIGGLLSLFSMGTPPSAPGRETTPEDAINDGELTVSKAPAAKAQNVSSVDHSPTDTSDMSPNKRDLSNIASASAEPSGVPEDSEETRQTHASRLSVSTAGSFDGPLTPKKKRNRSNKSKKRGGKQMRDSSCEDAEGEDKASMSMTTSSAPKDRASETYDPESDTRSDGSSATMGRTTPPVTPTKLTPSKRRRIEQRMTETEHIVTSPAPRNQHSKKKSYSRSASSPGATPARETTPPPANAPSETEIEQQSRVLQIYHIANEDNDSSRLLVLTGMNDDVSNINIGYLRSVADRGIKIIQYGEGSEDEDGNETRVMVASADAETLESLGGTGERVSEQIDSEPESTK